MRRSADERQSLLGAVSRRWDLVFLNILSGGDLQMQGTEIFFSFLIFFFPLLRRWFADARDLFVFVPCFFLFHFFSGGDLQMQGSEISLTKDFAIDDRTVLPPPAPFSSSLLLEINWVNNLIFSPPHLHTSTTSYPTIFHLQTLNPKPQTLNPKP